MKLLNDYKWIISSGCSYGRMIDSVIDSPKFIKNKIISNKWNDIHLETDEKIISINVSLVSSGTEWQSDSVIYVCNKLLSLGVLSDNIYCFVEWSQWSRFMNPLHQFIGKTINDIEWRNSIDYNFTIKTNDNYIKNIHYLIMNKLDLGRGSHLFNLGKIESSVYMTASESDKNSFKNVDIEFKHWYEYSLKIENEIPIDIKVKLFLNNILKTQWFLKSNNINYNFISMQSNFHGWYNDNGIVKHSLTHSPNQSIYYIHDNLIKLNKNYNPNNSFEYDIEYQIPHIKHLYDLIEFNNFWHYESELYRRGGIDEWAIDTFKECGYITFELTNDNSPPKLILPRFGFHPNVILYGLIWNEVSSNCKFLKLKKTYIDSLTNMFWEDYNSFDTLSLNGVTVSKNKITTLQKFL